MVATVLVFNPLNGFVVILVLVTVAPVNPKLLVVMECKGVPYCVSNWSVSTVLIELVAIV